MRRKFFISSIIPFLFLLMLGGCLGPDYLVTSSGPAVAEEAASLREGEPPHYTDHRAATAKPEIVRIAIDGQFTLYERAKILRAVNEWNHVLNGFVRFDIDPAADKEPVWIIVPVRGGRPPPVSGMIIGHALAATQAVEPIGGVVIVYVDRVRGYDLASVMRHELGHVLGLGHDPNGRLMSSRYTASHQQCIDRAAAEAVAASRTLPPAALNWCEEFHVASAYDGSVTGAATSAAR
jgi:Matrixin